MKVNRLSANEVAEYGFNWMVTIDKDDLSAAALTKTLAIYPETGTAAAGTVVRKAAARVVTAFAGTTTLVVEVGDGGDVDRALASSDMTAAAGTVYPAIPTTVPAAFAAADTVDALFTATVDNLDQLSAGEVQIFLDVVDLALITNN